MTRYAVIDLGTNTFHILIAEATPEGGVREICRERRFIKLAEGGIAVIGEGPYRRGIEAMRDYRAIIDRHDVRAVRATGTAALRTAANGPGFMRQVEAETGITVELISGDREAELIHRGVRWAVPFEARPYLIMDIGGGSVEFIIADAGRVYWAKSFPVGLAILFHGFHRSDPLAAAELAAMRAFLDERLAPLHAALADYPASELVGAAGTFEVLEDMLATERPGPRHTLFPAGRFRDLYQQVLPSTAAERRRLDKLPAERVDMFVVALVLIQYVLEKTGLERVIVSEYALKEGLLHEMMNGKRVDGLAS